MHEILEDEGALVKGAGAFPFVAQASCGIGAAKTTGSAVRPRRSRKAKQAFPFLFHFGAVEKWLEDEGAALQSEPVERPMEVGRAGQARSGNTALPPKKLASSVRGGWS
jgi:hypothetical protein